MADFVQTGPFSRQAAANVEKIPGQFWGMLQGVGRNLGRAGQYLSSEKAARDYANLLSGQLPQIGRVAVAKPNRDMESADIPIWDPVAEKYVYAAAKQVPIVTGLDKDNNVDRRKSDLYKQYAQTPEGQFERYFKTPEMMPYFGSAFQGQGAPTSAQQMLDLASQTTAPTSSPLAGFYAAQSASGRGNMGEIIEALGYKGTPLEKWAQANPMLAFREYNKRFPAGQPTQGPTPALPGPPMTTTGTAGEKALQEAKFKLYEEDNASPAPTVGQRTQEFLAGVGNPVVPTEDRAGTGLTQGERVDLGRGVQNIQAWQKMRTQGYQSAFQPDAQSLF